MPVSATDRALLETHPHKAKVYLVVHQPETALACRVNGAPSGDPVVSITYDGVTEGASGNVEAGQTLLIGSSAGDWDRGIVRVKSADATTISIAESSDLVGIVQDNDYLTVLYEHRFWIKFPRIVSLTDMYEDYDVDYTNEDTAFGPVAMMGPCGFAFLDGASVDLDYDFTSSYPIAGSSISSYATTYQHGDGGSSATGTHTETYSAATGMSGSETKLTVTDNNGKTASGWRYDFILSRSGANAPVSKYFVPSGIKNTWEGASPVDFVIYGSDAARTVLRDGTRIWLVFESWYGDTQKEISLEYPDRANILFEGWVIGSTINRLADHDFVSFTAVPITEMLQEGKAFPATLELASTPAEWYQVSSCTTIKAALYLMKWRSTLLEIVDVTIPSSPTSIAGEDWSSGSLKSQLDQILSADMYFIAQHKTGQLWIERPINLQNTSARSSLDTTMCIESKHWIPPLEIPMEFDARTSYVLFEGVAVDGDDGYPYFAEAPGVASKYRGKDGGRKDQLAIASQSTLNQWVGDWLAMDNATYPNIPVNLAGFWPVFDVVPQRRTWLGVSAAMNNRGINISGSDFIVRETEFQIDHSSGFATASVVLTEETDGQDGQAVTYAVEPPYSYPDFDMPPYILPYLPPGRTTVDEGRRIIATNVGVFATDDISASSPRWYAVNAGIPSGAERCWKIFRDPHHWWSSGGDERTLWGIFSDEDDVYSGIEMPRYIYKMTGFPNGTWTQVMDAMDFAFDPQPTWQHWVCDVIPTIEAADRIYVAIHHHISGLDLGDGWFVYSTNGGSSWSSGVEFTAASISTHPTWPRSCYYLDTAKHSGAGTIYVSQTDGAGVQWTLRKSADTGASWATTRTDAAVWGGNAWGPISVPYHAATWGDTDLIQRVVHPEAGVGQGAAWLRRSQDSGVSWSNIGENLGAGYTYRAGSGYALNRLVYATIVAKSFNTIIKLTENGGSSWTTWATLAGVTSGFSGLFLFDEGELSSVMLALTDGGTIAIKQVTTDGTVDKTGNLTSVATGINTVMRIERDSMGGA